MLKKLLSIVLVVSALNLVGFRSAYATGNEEKAARFTERVKEGISKLGTGPQARVQIKLRNNTKLKGYISEANTTSFTVIDANGVAAEIPYPQVKQIKGNNLSQNVAVAIAFGILAAVIILIASIKD